MIIIKCAKCNGKIFKYVKIGKGRLLHCWKDKIVEDLSVPDGINIKCNCGKIIGIDKGNEIKLKQNSIVILGTRTW